MNEEEDNQKDVEVGEDGVRDGEGRQGDEGVIRGGRER